MFSRFLFPDGEGLPDFCFPDVVEVLRGRQRITNALLRKVMCSFPRSMLFLIMFTQDVVAKVIGEVTYN